LASKLIFKSKIINKTLNPVWNEHFTTILDNINQVLSIKVYDYDFGLQDDFMGTAFIDLMKVKWNE